MERNLNKKLAHFVKETRKKCFTKQRNIAIFEWASKMAAGKSFCLELND